MTKWKHRVDIRSVVLKYDEHAETRETIVACGKEIARTIREAKLPKPFFDDISDLVEDWEAENCDTPEEMNMALQELYEWGDLVKVWLGDSPAGDKMHEDHRDEPLEGTGE